MKYALVNPNWTFDGSVYFGCRQPHLPLEFGYAKALIEQAGHEAHIVDAHLEDLSPVELAGRVDGIGPDFIVLATAPTYLFWRCAPPELRRPMETAALLGRRDAFLVAVGPHASATPQAALRKLGCDIAVLGECEEVLPLLADGAAQGWDAVPHIAYAQNGRVVRQGPVRETRLDRLPALAWPDEAIRRHVHHHHRFDAEPDGPGAEVEASRGCPFACAFCAKGFFRDRYRVRPRSVVLEEIDRLLAQGVSYIYFVDEIFLPDEPLLTALAERPARFGVQTRIDMWSERSLELLGRAGCVSMEAGVEAVTEAGRARLGKRVRMSTQEMTRLLLEAKAHIPFVQANLLRVDGDDQAAVREWREGALAKGLWANEPVPVFPYPGAPLHARLFGPVDDRAWERAHEHYLRLNSEFSDIQSEVPLGLAELEACPGARGT